VTGTLGELRARWSDSDRRDLVKDAVNALLAGDSLDSLPIGRHHGRFDLRASWLVSTRGVSDPTLAGRLGAVPTLRNKTIADIDFTASTARLNLDGCVMANCVLDRVGWQGWSVHRSQIEDCSFVRADLRDSHFDAGNDVTVLEVPGGRSWQDHGARTAYRRCNFTRTRTGPYVGWGNALFDDCLFADTAFSNYAGPQFRGASFTGCTFTGHYKSLEFGYGRQPTGLPEPLKPAVRNVDFHRASIDYLTFNQEPEDCDLPLT
jgi:uncharacterized protein YjbI with pentapeptide repeats